MILHFIRSFFFYRISISVSVSAAAAAAAARPIWLNGAVCVGSRVCASMYCAI